MRRILLHSETRDRKFLLLEQLIDLLNLNASDVAVSDFEFVSRELASEGIEVAALDKAWKKYMRFGVDDEKRAILMSLFDTFAELNISWQEFFELANQTEIPSDFMTHREDLPAEERNLF